MPDPAADRGPKAKAADTHNGNAVTKTVAQSQPGPPPFPTARTTRHVPRTPGSIAARCRKVRLSKRARKR